ncbi:PQQ-dependent sugar dehydrogenase [Seonamhaeicola sp. MEBiC1930]|uniref:PQQ-dependent sugar dehydrogenase n=1 Tax=Seonamhaeicola sp. MEBiC01930 TaxID=2976768 RepID=UPI00324CEEDD
MKKISLLIFFILINCKNSEHIDRPYFENPKFIIQLNNTRLLVSEVLRDLDQPWEIAWGSDEHLWFTQRKGKIMRMDVNTGKVKTVLNLKDVYSKGRTIGLLGMTLHPDFNNSPHIYMHYTYIDSTSTSELDFIGNINYFRSKVMQYEYSFKEDTLINPKSVLTNISAYKAHNGSRLCISNDNKIFLALGDAAYSRNAQIKSSLPGKILRMNLDGSIPEDNPIANSYLYSMGHRNPQGLVVANGKIYSSEHGTDNDDEINLIKPMGNYGWPFVQGYCDKEIEMAFCDSLATTEPLYNWTPTIAPAGLDYYNHEAIPEWKNHLMLTTLKGCALWLFELNNEGEKIVNKKIYLQKKFGRLRDLCVSSKGDIYVVTSNSDWHIPRYKWMYDSIPKEGNDRILKISILQESEEEKFKNLSVFYEDKEPAKMFVQSSPESLLFKNNCVSCHMSKGEGIPNFVPPIQGTKTIANKKKLIETVLFGMSGEIEVKGKKYNDVMPGFSESLTNEELKILLNYIREYSNYTDTISIKEIDDIRKSRRY